MFTEDEDYYSPTLFKAIGISDTALYTGIYGLVKGEFTPHQNSLR